MHLLTTIQTYTEKDKKLEKKNKQISWCRKNNENAKDCTNYNKKSGRAGRVSRYESRRSKINVFLPFGRRDSPPVYPKTSRGEWWKSEENPCLT